MQSEEAAPGFRAVPIVVSPPRPAPISLHAVNGWRGPGAFAIAFGHFAVAMDFVSYRTLAPLALLVDLFFVLSGLLIAQAYTERLSRASAIPEYIVRRFGRIWPVQAATLAALIGYELAKLAAQMLIGHPLSASPFAADGIDIVPAIWTNLLLIHSLGLHDRETWNFPSWSLSVEFATYSVFAAFCLLPPRARRGAALATVVLAVGILASVAPNHMRSTYDFGIFRCLAGFFAGTLCFEAVRTWRLPKWPFPTLAECLALVLVVAWMILGAGNSLALAAPLTLCLFIVAFLPARGLISRMLLAKPLQLLAELSFAVYMVHAVVIFGLMAGLHGYERWSGGSLFVEIPNPLAVNAGFHPTVLVPHIVSPALRFAIGAAYFAIVLAVAWLTYHLVETPGRAFFGGLAKLLSRSIETRSGPSADQVVLVSDALEKAS